MTDDQTKIQTLGPPDPNAPTRAKVYASLAVLTPLLSALATFGVISTEQGNALTGFLTAAIGLLSAFGFGFAATKTNTQVNNGTFDPAPVTPTSSVIEQLGQIKAEVDKTVEHTQNQLADGVAAIQAATSLLPGGKVVGGLTDRVLSGPVGDLIQAMVDREHASDALHRRSED